MMIATTCCCSDLYVDSSAHLGITLLGSEPSLWGTEIATKIYRLPVNPPLIGMDVDLFNRLLLQTDDKNGIEVYVRGIGSSDGPSQFGNGTTLIGALSDAQTTPLNVEADGTHRRCFVMYRLLSELGTQVIRSFPYDGSGGGILLSYTHAHGSDHGLAYDPTTDTLFFGRLDDGGSFDKYIRAVSGEGGSDTVIVTLPVGTILGSIDIAIDRRLIVWTDLQASNWYIRTANLDGTGQADVLDLGTLHTTYARWSHKDQRIYYVTTVAPNTFGFGSCSLDGSGNVLYFSQQAPDKWNSDGIAFPFCLGCRFEWAGSAAREHGIA